MDVYGEKRPGLASDEPTMRQQDGRSPSALNGLTEKGRSKGQISTILPAGAGFEAIRTSVHGQIGL